MIDAESDDDNYMNIDGNIYGIRTDAVDSFREKNTLSSRFFDNCILVLTENPRFKKPSQGLDDFINTN